MHIVHTRDRGTRIFASQLGFSWEIDETKANESTSLLAPRAIGVRTSNQAILQLTQVKQTRQSGHAWYAMDAVAPLIPSYSYDWNTQNAAHDCQHCLVEFIFSVFVSLCTCKEGLAFSQLCSRLR